MKRQDHKHHGDPRIAKRGVYVFQSYICVNTEVFLHVCNNDRGFVLLLKEAIRLRHQQIYFPLEVFTQTSDHAEAVEPLTPGILSLAHGNERMLQPCMAFRNDHRRMNTAV